MKQYLGYIIKKAMGKGKVSPTIKSVKPNLTKSVKQTKGERFTKNIKALDRAEGKLKTGREMMREGQKERKKLVDTGRAFQFKGVKSYHAMGPGDKEKYGKSMKVAGPQKKFKTGKELEREKKMGGGMMGRRFGMKKGTPNPFKKETNVEKIKKTFAPKSKVKFDAKKSDLDKSGSLSPYEKRRGMAIAKAMAKRKKVI
jgi:hypothetical protein|tara:strand:+ start:213 stop:809 length:597 start_codon:yes stop_codon:yes gene_type:complete